MCKKNTTTTNSTHDIQRACEKTKDYTETAAATSCVGTIKGHGIETVHITNQTTGDTVETSDGCKISTWEPVEWVTKNCTSTTTTITPACTGVLPPNASILANVGNTSRAWTYDGSPTGPYQSCTFRCNGSALYQNGTCATATTTLCPTYTAPICTDGTLVDGGKDTNGCALAQTCEKKIVTCPTYTAPPSNFCSGGQIIDSGKDTNGCQIAPTCTPKLTIGTVTIDGAKDCWFGDITKKITLGDFIGYETPAGSGIKYLDEILFYGSTSPETNLSPINILSYEE